MTLSFRAVPLCPRCRGRMSDRQVRAQTGGADGVVASAGRIEPVRVRPEWIVVLNLAASACRNVSPSIGPWRSWKLRPNRSDSPRLCVIEGRIGFACVDPSYMEPTKITSLSQGVVGGESNVFRRIPRGGSESEMRDPKRNPELEASGPSGGEDRLAVRGHPCDSNHGAPARFESLGGLAEP